jgi:protein-L-isoaspartate(D-aspartate) O-methyltransferase
VKPSDDPLAVTRHTMVERDIKGRGVSDKRVLAAMERVPRDKFVEVLDRGTAYADHPLTIDCGQTISQPYIVAFMTEALKLNTSDRVLEVGTGSGYQAAILAEIAKEVYTIERFDELSEHAKQVITELGYKNVYFSVSDGTLGWKSESPFDAIIVTAATPKVPPSLVKQLSPGGRIIAPLGGKGLQYLVRLTKDSKGAVKEETLIPCVFVPLVGAEGFPD